LVRICWVTRRYTVAMRLFRVILPVEDIEQATRFYRAILSDEGERVSSGRHYFDCDGVLLALWDPCADGDPEFPGPNPAHIYLSTHEPLETVRQRAIGAGAVPDPQRGSITRQPWGERSFYVSDPWGNPVCIVEYGTEYRGGPFPQVTT
jgi:catechol 2,3-dioxygenase-like lactoylglutathione lyase family enzyme